MSVVAALDGPELTVDAPILGAAVVLLAGVAVTGLATRFRMPSLVLVLGLGMLVADDGVGVIEFDDAALAQNLSVLALVLILFQGGLATRWRDMRKVIVPAGLLATVGVAVTATTVAALTWLLFDIEASTAWIIGAVVASTDVAAVLATLRGSPVPKRLADVLRVESGLNDPVAVLLTVGFVAAATTSVGPLDWLEFGARQFLVGGAAGAIVGFVAGIGTRHVRLPAASMYTVSVAAVGAAAYGIAAVAGGSTFLAVYVAGVVLGGMAPRRLRPVQAFYDGLAEAAQIGLFFVLGILVFPSNLLDDIGLSLVVAAVLALVARPLAVAVSLLWLRFPPRELAFLSWAGLRGAVPIVLATFPLTAGNPDGPRVFNIVFVVVIVSAIVQGSTIGGAARRLGIIPAAPPTAPAIIEPLPSTELEADLAEVVLPPDAAVVGKSLGDRPPPDQVRVLLIGRAGRTFLPTAATTLHAGDQLMLAADEGLLDPTAVATWLRDGQ